MAQVSARVREGLVNPETDLHPEHAGMTPEDALDRLRRTLPDGEDLVRNAIVPVTVIDTFALPDPAHLPDEATLAAQLAAFTSEQQRQIAMVVDRIGPRVGKIVMIPHDSKLKRGNLFEWDALQQLAPPSRRSSAGGPAPARRGRM